MSVSKIMNGQTTLKQPEILSDVKFTLKACRIAYGTEAQDHSLTAAILAPHDIVAVQSMSASNVIFWTNNGEG